MNDIIINYLNWIQINNYEQENALHVRDVHGGAVATTYFSLPSRRGSGSLFFFTVAMWQRLHVS
jgi:hypothetical protein